MANGRAYPMKFTNALEATEAVRKSIPPDAQGVNSAAEGWTFDWLAHLTISPGKQLQLIYKLGPQGRSARHVCFAKPHRSLNSTLHRTLVNRPYTYEVHR